MSPETAYRLRRRINDDVQRCCPVVQVASKFAFDRRHGGSDRSVTVLGSRRCPTWTPFIFNPQATLLVVITHIVDLGAFESRHQGRSPTFDNEIAITSNSRDHLLRYRRFIRPAFRIGLLQKRDLRRCRRQRLYRPPLQIDLRPYHVNISRRNTRKEVWVVRRERKNVHGSRRLIYGLQNYCISTTVCLLRMLFPRSCAGMTYLTGQFGLVLKCQSSVS